MTLEEDVWGSWGGLKPSIGQLGQVASALIAWPGQLKFVSVSHSPQFSVLCCWGFLSKISANHIETMLRKDMEVCWVLTCKAAPHPSGRGWDSKPCC